MRATWPNNASIASSLCFILLSTITRDVVRSYLGYCAGSHQTSEAKRLWARIVLEWVTFREVLVTNPSLLHFSISKLAPHSIQLCYFCMASGSQSQLVFVQCQVSDKRVFIYQSKMCVIVSPLCIARPPAPHA